MSSLLRLATAGSVDDGKSTLVGRLLHDSKSVLADQLDAVERVSRERGWDTAAGALDLALLTDGLRAEREQGITIDVAYRYFATSRRSFVLADCPGHVQYTRNTVTGASTADVVVLLVDARHGVVEQTRRHLAVAALLRVPHVIVAVNKIDLVDFDQVIYDRIAGEIVDVGADLGVCDVRAVPVCAVDGDNVVERSERTAWYHGPALLELLEELPPRQDPARESLRMAVQVVLRPQAAARDDRLVDYRGYAGQITSGVVRVGDEITVLPSGKASTVVGIDLPRLSEPTDGEQVTEAFAPQSVALRLADELDVARGDLIVGSDSAVAPTQDVEGTICWLLDRTLRAGTRVLVKHGTAVVHGMVRDIDGRLDLDAVELVPSESLELNDIGRVQIRVAAPIAPDPYVENRGTGAFLLIDPQDGMTVAAGMVGDPLEAVRRPDRVPAAYTI